jgi:hypothetical protein
LTSSAIWILGGEDADEVTRRGIEQHHETLRGGVHGGEQGGASLVLARKGGELILDGLGIEDLALEQRRLDLELLVVPLELLDHAGRGARFLVAPGDARHALEHDVELLGLIAERLLDQRVLADLVFHALGAEHAAEVRHLFDRHAGEVDEHGARHAVEALFDGLDGFRLFGAKHQRSSSATTLVVSMRTPGPMVLESVMLRR